MMKSHPSKDGALEFLLGCSSSNSHISTFKKARQCYLISSRRSRISPPFFSWNSRILTSNDGDLEFFRPFPHAILISHPWEMGTSNLSLSFMQFCNLNLQECAFWNYITQLWYLNLQDCSVELHISSPEPQISPWAFSSCKFVISNFKDGNL